MNYSFEYIDIILLAMIAGFIFLRLRGILGKRSGFDGKAPPKFEEVLKNVKIIIALGKIAFDACIKFYKENYLLNNKNLVFDSL